MSASADFTAAAAEAARQLCRRHGESRGVNLLHPRTSIMKSRKPKMKSLLTPKKPLFYVT
jgi:hypothetical protein